MEGTLSPANVYTKRQWIAKQAREHPSRVLSSLHHLIDLDWMFEAWALTRKDGAAGIDGRTAADYETDLEANLESLLSRIKSGSYRAPPVRRHYIPKADGSKRPLGIPTIEDKVAQRAILMLLEPIYEADFMDGSFGFRPDRGAHDALRQLCNGWATGMSGLAAIVEKYPKHEFTARRLHAFEPEFKALCDDFTVAMSTFRRWSEDQERAEQYRQMICELEQMIRELEDEALEYLEGRHPHQIKRTRR